MQSEKNTNKILFLCYHYLKRDDEYARIYGYELEQFKTQVDKILQEFEPINVRKILDYRNGEGSIPKKSVVFAFDDGLKEHAEFFAPYLASKNISAIFSTPACIFENRMANPQIVHFLTAKYGIRNLNETMEKYFDVTGMQFSDFFEKDKSKLPLMEFYKYLKKVLFYKLPVEKTELLLNKIYEEVLKKDDPDILSKVYMNKDDLKKIKSMGHEIGCHTYSHPIFTRLDLNDDIWFNEIIRAKKIIESIIDDRIISFSYPYNNNREEFDYFGWRDRLRNTGFELAFNTYNRKGAWQGEFDPYWVKRYSVQSGDDFNEIKNNAFIYQI